MICSPTVVEDFSCDLCSFSVIHVMGRAMLHTHTHAEVNKLAVVSTSPFCLIGPFAVQSHLSWKPLPSLIALPFVQAPDLLVKGKHTCLSPAFCNGLQIVSHLSLEENV